MNSNGESLEWSKDILCRNIAVYGFCKNEATCIYNHGIQNPPNNFNLNSANLRTEENDNNNNNTTSGTSAIDAFKQAAIAAANKKKSAAETTTSVSSTADTLKQMALNAVAKKKESLASSATTNTEESVSSSKLLLQKALEKKGLSIQETKKEETTSSGFNLMRPNTPPVSAVQMNSHGSMMHSPIVSSGSLYQQSPLMAQPPLQPPLFSANSTSSFIPTTPLQANMNFMAASVVPGQPGSMFSTNNNNNNNNNTNQMPKNASDFFLDEQLKHLIRNNTLDLNTFPMNSNNPLVVQDYTQLSLLWSDREGKNFYYKCKKLNGEESNKTFLLHRVAKLGSTELPLPRDISNINKSNKHLKDAEGNCNILKMEATFVTASFMDNSLCHVYEYYPLMVQMNEFLHIDPLGTGVCQMKLDDLWFVLFQLLNFVKFLFQNKLHLASGIKDIEDFISFDKFFVVLNSDNSFILKYKNMGDILVNKCLKDTSGVVKPSKGFGANVQVASCLNKVGLIWKNLVVSCNSLVNDVSINEVIKYLKTEDVELDKVSGFFEFSRLSNFFNQLINFNALLFDNLSKNFNNETFLKIIIKFNVVMSDYSDKNPAWLPNGSKYPLKLFFDNVFQDHNSKSKSLNYGHIIKHLSKLDSGIYENCILANNDKTTCLIINYRDLKMLVEVNYSIMMNKGDERYK
ncbi:hypothetical protein ACO0SA_001900 [Hanseniaspora valbyensis]